MTETDDDLTETERIIEEVNDLLVAALGDGNTYRSHDEVRPSAVRGFKKVQQAHFKLTQIDPTRTGEHTEDA